MAPLREGRATGLQESGAIDDRCIGAKTHAERTFGAVLADVLHVDSLPVDSNFFDDLRADSLVMAHFCARVRKRGDLPPVSMRDIYRYPTIRSLSAALAESAPSTDEPAVTPAIEAAPPVSSLEYVLCGALQLLFFLAYCYVAALAGAAAYDWISTGSGAVDI